MNNSDVLTEYEKAADPEQPALGGGVGYDLSRFDSRRRVREAVRQTPEQRGEPVRKGPARAKFSFGALLLYFIAAGLAALLISSYMRMTILTDELSKLSSTLENLQNEEITLQKEYDGRYILSDIEAYAVNNLNMVKLEGGMMEYIELSNPDTITVVKPHQDDKVAGFLEKLEEHFREFVEFLT